MGCRRIHRLRIRMEYLGILLPTLQLGMERYVHGYFLDNVFNTDEGPVYNDNGEQTRSHFRFKLKYATFTKH